VFVDTSASSHDAAEALLGTIRGVLAARVVRASDESVAEVHVVAAPGRSAKAIVRDAESLLYVRLGLRVDYRKISLVQVEEGSFQPAPPRLRLESVVCEEDRGALLARVALNIGNQQIQGAAHATDGHEAALLRASVLATVDAIAQLPGLRGSLSLEHVERHHAGRQDVCIVHLTLQNDEYSEDLLGIASLRGSPTVAASRAALDAVNRRLASWLQPAG
jgi:hypothetical protein